MTIPSQLIILRIFLILPFLALLAVGGEIGRYAALTIFIIAAATDLFDGVIARKCNQVTDFYKIMDPLADKLLICSALIALLAAGAVPAWFVIMIVFRDFIITGLRLFIIKENAVPGAVITGKINTFLQMALIIVILAGYTSHILIYAIVLFTIISLAENFIRNFDTIKRIKL
ncbi:MAG: CDP-diacylglycerol--glycerol-3-phosphate 3-phosphatidyltransferase [Alphaproteobacteria bacterium]|nr:CDP-diacylglycerol--glycerol-3-phosphate 3-phosphatidyltransferase [Alphaproteobacteria bacterium]